MELTGILICALATVLLGALIQKTNKEYSLLLTLSAVVLILLSVVQKVAPLVQELTSLLSAGLVDSTYFTVMLKAVGVAILGQVGSTLCKDAGESSLAYTVDFAAKTAILLLSLPVLTQVFSLLGDMMAG